MHIEREKLLKHLALFFNREDMTDQILAYCGNECRIDFEVEKNSDEIGGDCD